MSFHWCMIFLGNYGVTFSSTDTPKRVVSISIKSFKTSSKLFLSKSRKIQCQTTSWKEDIHWFSNMYKLTSSYHITKSIWLPKICHRTKTTNTHKWHHRTCSTTGTIIWNIGGLYEREKKQLKERPENMTTYNSQPLDPCQTNSTSEQSDYKTS